MWIIAMFDLPVKRKLDRRAYSQFRKALIIEGFTMMQYSVYARYCSCEDKAKLIRRRVKQLLPARGHVRMMGITDRQFGKMEVYLGQKRGKSESAPQQLMLW